MSDPQILYDYQIFALQKYGGISRMFAEIMQYLHDQRIHFDLPLQCSANANIKGRVFFRPVSYRVREPYPVIENWLVPGRFPGKSVLYRFARLTDRSLDSLKKRREKKRDQQAIMDRLKSGAKLVFHPTYFDDYYMDVLSEKSDVKYVLTVYDLIHELFPGYFPREDIVLRNRLRLCERADKIIAISHSTKRDLMETYGIAEEKISVIHLASRLKADENFDDDFFLGDYILFVGDRWSYKNFANFVSAVAPVVMRHRCTVVFAGAGPFSPEEIRLLSEHKILGKCRHVPIQNDSHLASLYRGARLFVFPSLYEGFGIPLLEAMSQRCPVVCSNTSSFPEVAGDAVEMFDPWDVDSMTDAIQRVYESESLSSTLRAKGLIRAGLFSWEKVGKEHLRLYESLLN